MTQLAGLLPPAPQVISFIVKSGTGPLFLSLRAYRTRGRADKVILSNLSCEVVFAVHGDALESAIPNTRQANPKSKATGETEVIVRTVCCVLSLELVLVGAEMVATSWFELRAVIENFIPVLNV